jgi:hypothetical protein
MSKEIQALTDAGKYSEAINKVAKSGDKELQAKYKKYWKMKDFSKSSIDQAVKAFGENSKTNFLSYGVKKANEMYKEK